MTQLTNTQRKHLKRLAHSLKPLVMIGKQGLTEQVRISVDQALMAHELIKVKFGDFKDEKEALTAELANETGSALVTIIGNVAVLYRQHPDEDRRKIDLPM